MDESKSRQHHTANIVSPKEVAAVPKVPQDPQGSHHKPSMALGNVDSSPAPQPPKLHVPESTTTLSEPGQGSTHTKPHVSNTAAPSLQASQSTNRPQHPARKQDEDAHLHAHPMIQEGRSGNDAQPDHIPARPSSAFAAMAGRALDASGSLSGSFSRELPHKASTGAALKAAGSSGRRLQSFDSALSSDSRFEGLQQAACADTSSSDDEAEPPGAHERKPVGQVRSCLLRPDASCRVLSQHLCFLSCHASQGILANAVGYYACLIQIKNRLMTD